MAMRYRGNGCFLQINKVGDSNGSINYMVCASYSSDEDSPEIQNTLFLSLNDIGIYVRLGTEEINVKRD